MKKWKITEIAILAVTALINAAQSLMKFIGYIGKLLKRKPKESIASA